MFIVPETKCWVLINFQSSNLGFLFKDSLSWINDFLSFGIKSPERSKLFEIIVEISLPTFNDLTSYEKKSVIAIGVGFMVPWEIPISSSSLNKFLENKNNKIKTM